MNSCTYCGYSLGSHDRYCPEVSPDLLEMWRRGYNHALSGIEYERYNLSGAYALGWVRGDSQAAYERKPFNPADVQSF